MTSQPPRHQAISFWRNPPLPLGSLFMKVHQKRANKINIHPIHHTSPAPELSKKENRRWLGLKRLIVSISGSSNKQNIFSTFAPDVWTTSEMSSLAQRRTTDDKLTSSRLLRHHCNSALPSTRLARQTLQRCISDITAPLSSHLRSPSHLRYSIVECRPTIQSSSSGEKAARTQVACVSPQGSP